LRDIYQGQTSHLSFEELYKCGYRFVLSHQSDELYKNLSKFLEDLLIKTGKDITALSGDKLIEFYNKSWDSFLTSNQMARDVVVVAERSGTHSLRELQLQKWRACVFDPAQDILSDLLVNLLQRQRNGEYIEQLPRKGLIASLCKYRFLLAVW
jgi:hypothetical protein